MQRDIICTLCQLKGSSKCPGCRSTFSKIPFQFKSVQFFLSMGQWNRKPALQFTQPLFEGTLDEAFDTMRGLLNDYASAPDVNKPTIKQLACDHSWSFVAPGECELGCQFSRSVANPPSSPNKRKVEDDASEDTSKRPHTDPEDPPILPDV